MKLNIGVGIVLSVLFLFLAFRKINFSEIIGIIPQINWYIILLLIPVSFLLFGLRAIRWYFLMKSIKRITIRSLFSSIMIGFMINHTFPLRIGEFVRAYSLARKEEIKFTECFGTIITERVFDLLSLLLIFIPLLLIPAVAGKLGPATIYIMGFSILLFGVFICFYFFGLKIMEFKLIRRLIPANIHRIALDVISGIQSLKNFRDVLLLLFFSILFWLLSGYFFYLSLGIFGISGLPLWSGFFILLLIAFGVALPSGPGYIGNYHYFAMIALEFFNIPKETALGFAILTHLLQTVFVVAVGLVCLFFEGFKLSEAWSQARIQSGEKSGPADIT
jgi:uncharacterized protein (TIRG00374 family)